MIRRFLGIKSKVEKQNELKNRLSFAISQTVKRSF